MNLPKRKATRLQNYDYSNNNYYFVTICTHEKKCIFGDIHELNTMGYIAKTEMENLENHHHGVYVENFIIMPNHVHAIIVLCNQNKSLNEIIGNYKAGVSRKIRLSNPNIVVWQRSFHDHIIRNEKSYKKIWEYVKYNDQKWTEDCFFVSDQNI